MTFQNMRLPTLITTAIVLATAVARADEPASPVDFARDVQPIFANHCLDCHGQKAREAGLRLDRHTAALAGGDSGVVIVPGKPDDSLLIKYVSGDGETVMPPDSEGLVDDEVTILRRWIAEGANWPATADAHDPARDHWAYQPLVRREPPAAPDGATHPIDRFVRAKLAADGIPPSPEADRATLIKRLYYDLLGLPPEPDAVDAFVRDTSPLAYTELVDDLLASPHFGERWGRHWLDVARYADSDGYEKDNPRYNAWRYRDWVIQAINNDLPFDQFTIQQLAGDLLPNRTTDQLVATGFNRQTLTNTEGGTDPEQWRVEAVFDRVETLGTAWLGLTVGCARCHSHKYDAITQREYYQFFAFFNNGDETTAPIATSEQAMQEFLPKQAAFEAQLVEKRKPLDERKAELAPNLSAWEQEQQTRLAGKLDQPSKLEDIEMNPPHSTGGAMFERDADGSYLASGAMPATDVYEVDCVLPMTGVTALQIDALPHDSLSKSGPGRSEKGHFVLSELEVTLHTADGDHPLRFADARSEDVHEGFDAKQAIDGQLDDGGWAVLAKNAKPHSAVFYLSDEARTLLAAQPAPVKIKARLVQQYSKEPMHTLGRFKLRAMTGFDEHVLGIPENIRQILAVGTDKRDQQQQQALLDHFAGLDPMYRELKAGVDEFQKQAPFKPEMTVAIVQERTDNRRATKLFRRGDFLSPQGDVPPGTLETLPPLAIRNAAAPDRLDLAQWLVSAGNP
ncbi:MAG: DUF1549 domain-containing protein, partial [Planctomycetaceae bacterium]